IYHEKPTWSGKPKIDSHNEEVVENILRAPRQQIYEEKLKWHADPKIDSHNDEAIEQIKRAPKPAIYDERFSWPSFPRIDHFNEEYAKYKQRDKNLRREKSFVQSFPQDYRPQTKEARIDHRNLEFEEYRKRKKSAKLPPIEDRKLEWSKKPRIIQRNDEYIERIRQKRSMPMIFREKLKWGTKTPKIDARNDGYVESLKAQPKRKVSLKHDEYLSTNIPIESMF
ncbi:unnamed protein product, partial [Rotaria magnacalcarata]